MPRSLVVGFALVALLLCAGCATGDYHQTRYYRESIRQIERAAATPQPASQPETLSAGAARVEITPPVGFPLQGFGARMGQPSQGVRDPLYARVLVLQTEHGRLVLVSCDLMAVTENLYETIYEKASRRVRLRRSEFICFATHTHSGAGGLTDRFALQFVSGRFRPGFFQVTTDKIAGAIVEAVQRVQPARIGFGKARVPDLNRNRAIAGGPVDREVKVVRLTAGDKPIAWLVNFAAHPTILGANWEFSADFPGELARGLEHDGTVCLFANGAAGDLNIEKQPGESHEARLERAGRTLAEKTLEIAASLTATNSIAMECQRFEVELPPVKIRISQHIALPSWLGNHVFPRRVPVYLARLDHELLLAVPAELSAEIGLKWKEIASRLGFDLFVIGYANDYTGYVMPERYYASKAYEARTSFYGPKLDAYLTELVVRMMETMKTRSGVPE